MFVVYLRFICGHFYSILPKFTRLYSNVKKLWNQCISAFQWKEGDSNPRNALDVYTLSRRVTKRLQAIDIHPLTKQQFLRCGLFAVFSVSDGSFAFGEKE
jgi:hypothetical protein